MARVLLLATTTGYQTRSFGEAAERLGVDLVLATDRCHVLEDPWGDRAVPVRFYDEEWSAHALLEFAAKTRIDGVLAVGDRPTVIAGLVLEGLGLPGHSANAARTARNKLLSRARLSAVGLRVPFFSPIPIDADVHTLAESLPFPVVIKPLVLSGSRGVVRVNNRQELVAAFYRLRSLFQAPDIRAIRDDAGDMVLVEGFIEGHEYAVEAVMHHGSLQVLAVFDKPDPLDGPFFEETIYVTPPSIPLHVEAAIARAVAQGAHAFGLWHGPIHAECRVNGEDVWLLEVAARPIGGLCARSLRFRRQGDAGPLISLEELLLRHAIGEPSENWTRELTASGVMMIPIPRRGVFRRTAGLERARAVTGIDDVRITAKTDQLLLPLPEGASYLGFIFAHGADGRSVEHALREAHENLEFTIDPEVPVVQSRHG
jgi:ATP-grasp domain/L-amino acid ligase C-terminal domain 2/ATP-grasp N-terminal domain